MTVGVGPCAHTVCDNHISACEEAAPFGFGADANRAAHGCDIVIVGFVYLRTKGHICRNTAVGRDADQAPEWHVGISCNR